MTLSHLSRRTFAFYTILASIVYASSAQADGLSDLKNALVQYQGHAPIRAVVEAKTWNRQGDGKELEETNGSASVIADESNRGLQVNYSKDMLNRLENEERLKEKNPQAKTPTLSALNEVNSSSLRPLLSAANDLKRTLDKATFKSEKADTYNGKPARLLNFEISIDKLTEKERKFMKKYDSTFDVWIAEDGTPLASRKKQTISGRAYVVISFEMKNEEEWVYGVVGDRLVALKKEARSSGSGMGEKGESKVVKTVQIQSKNAAPQLSAE